MGLGGAIILGLFILFCTGMIYGFLAQKDEKLSTRLGCAGPFALIIILTIVFANMEDIDQLRKLKKLFGLALIPSIALGAIFRVSDGDTGNWDSNPQGTWKGTIGWIFVFIGIVCSVCFAVLAILINDPSTGPIEPPEPYF